MPLRTACRSGFFLVGDGVPMSVIRPDERVAVFIDGQFLLKSLKTVSPRRFDYARIAGKLASPGRLTRVWYYDAPSPSYLPLETRRSAERRIEKLRTLPFFEVRMGRTKAATRKVVVVRTRQAEVAEYHQQKGVDVKLAIDMLGKAYRNEYDTAVLVSGDSDFVEMVKTVKEAGKHVVLACALPRPKLSYHPSVELRVACDSVVMLDASFLSGCELPDRPTGCSGVQ
jgi:uncharacterized LabA/DUF88 family protein